MTSSNLITLDWETYFDQKYSLRNKDYNTSQYIRDPQFVAHCVGIKVNDQKTHVYWYDDIQPALSAIDWDSAELLCHHTNFDGFILSHQYGITPRAYRDTMSMARGLHRNVLDSFSLDAVSKFYGVGNKLQNVLSRMKGHHVIPEDLRPAAAAYCAGDVDLTYLLYQAMIRVYPRDELDLIDLTCRMFCIPRFLVDIPRVERELLHETEQKAATVARCGYDVDELQSAGKLAGILQELGVTPPKKISPRTNQETFAFSQQDEEFMALGAHPDQRVREVIAARLAVKSTIGETRAIRFLEAGKNGWSLPVYYNYCGAHTTRPHRRTA
jgi:hypothetical protein